MWGPVWVEGTITQIDHRPTSERYVIDVEMLEAVAPDSTPARVRVTWRGDPAPVLAGDRVNILARLSPPPAPAVPGGFDYGQQLYFERIGAVGFAMSQPTPNAAERAITFCTRLENWRTMIADRIIDKSQSPAGSVAAAVVTGRRDQIPPDYTDRLRDTGLAHLLAISGLHMGLVCGYLFVALRFVFVLNERWAILYPVKKWPALAALAGGTLYLALSGGAWSAQRAYIMAGITFAAVLVDRQAISLRNVALAALVILILRPEALISAGFQMSFAAVMALVATYQAIEPRLRRARHRRFVERLGLYLLGLFITSLVAGLATAPFAMFHFNRIAVHGLWANCW